MSKSYFSNCNNYSFFCIIQLICIAGATPLVDTTTSYPLTSSSSFPGGDPVNATYQIDNQTSWQTNVHIENNDVEFELKSGKDFSFYPIGTCTTTYNRTNMTYTLSAHDDSPVPDWISLDNVTGNYTGKSPFIIEDESYSFVLNTNWTSHPEGNSSQVVTVVVGKQTSDLAVVVTAGAVLAGSGAGVAASAAISIVSGSPPTALYSILNLLQMVILFLIIDPFIPESLRIILEGNSLALLNFNFIPVVDLPYVEIPIDWMDSEQRNEILQTLDINSESSIVNNLSLIFTFTLILIIHILLRYVLVCGSTNEGQQSKFKRFWNWFRIKLLEVIKYVVYLRLFIEAHEAMLLSATSEIKEVNYHSASSILSSIFAF